MVTEKMIEAACISFYGEDFSVWSDEGKRSTRNIVRSLVEAALAAQEAAPVCLIERLRDADAHSQQRILGSRIFGEASDEIERLTRQLSELRSISTDKATAWDALSASHQRGRRKAFEEAAEIAEHAVWGWRGRNIAAALRSRAEEDGR